MIRHSNVLETTARLIVTLHHDRPDRDLVDGVPEGQYSDHFLVFAIWPEEASQDSEDAFQGSERCVVQEA